MISVEIVTEIKASFQGTELADERNRLGLTQEEIALRMEIRQQNYQRYEIPGKRTVSGETYKKLLEVGIQFKEEKVLDNLAIS